MRHQVVVAVVKVFADQRMRIGATIEAEREGLGAGRTGRGPARKQTTLERGEAGLGHDVSILIAAGGAAGRRGVAPRRKVSMMIMRPPQQGQGCGSVFGSLPSVAACWSPWRGRGGMARSSRARAILSLRVPLANRP